MKMRDIINLVEDAGRAEKVQTPFERWFADSKVVDHDGRPLKLFHGTSKDMDFKSFKVPKNGVWFTSDPKEASEYAADNDSQNHKWQDGGYVKTHTASRVVPCYVRAVNPVYMDEWPDVLQAENYKRAQAAYFDKLRMQGHDAIIFKGGRIVVVLGSPNQIKSAVGNVRFDPAKKNIDEEDEGGAEFVTTDELPDDIRAEAEHTVPDEFHPEGELVWRKEDVDVEQFCRDWDALDWLNRGEQEVVRYCEKLGADMQKHGQKTPLVLGPQGFEGHHRMFAAHLAGIPKLKAWVWHLRDEDGDVVAESIDATEPQWFRKGQPVTDPGKVNDDCHDILDAEEWDWEWRLCDVPLDQIDFINPDAQPVADGRMERLRGQESHDPVILSLQGERALLLDGWHRVHVAKERGQGTVKALVGTARCRD